MVQLLLARVLLKLMAVDAARNDGGTVRMMLCLVYNRMSPDTRPETATLHVMLVPTKEVVGLSRRNGAAGG